MLKVNFFDIDSKKDDQAEREMAMSPIQRVYLTLDLMDTCLAIAPDGILRQKDDHIDWITLNFVDAKSNS